MIKNRLRFYFLGICFVATSACVHSSVFKVEDDPHKNQIFQYCGGQQWGYGDKIGSEAQSPYLGVFLESNILTDSDIIVLNFAIASTEALNLSFEKKNIQISVDGTVVHDKPLELWILRGPKQIWQKYDSNKYTYSSIEGSANQWRVRKKKYGGLFGYMALEEPFIVTIDSPANEKTTGNKITVPFDKDLLDEIYVLAKIVIPFKEKRSTSSTIVAQTPQFEVNGKMLNSAKYTFHYNREKLIENIKAKPYRCTSLEEIFRAERNKDSGYFWMYPKIKSD